MAVYHIGKVLRMKREALGITREKLCEMSGEICSPQTLYRMETGKVKIKIEQYRVLMQCMGQIPERSYASIEVSENRLFSIKTDVHTDMLQNEYEKALEKLTKLETEINMGYPRNEQYLVHTKAVILYRLKQLTVQQYFEQLCLALRCTIPDYKEEKLRKWPLNMEEFLIVIHILEAYDAVQEREKYYKIVSYLKENINNQYFEYRYYVFRNTIINNRLSWHYEVAKNYKAAIEICEESISESKQLNLLGNVNEMLYDIYWAAGKLNNVDKNILKTYVESYYLSIAQNDQTMVSYYEKNDENLIV